MNPPRVAPPSPPELTVILPCYNEAESVEGVLQDWVTCLEHRIGNFEVVAINDGSNDGTGRVLDNLRKQTKGLRVIHQLNLGTSAAVKRGIEESRGNYVVVIDGEGRYEPGDFFRMWDQRLGRLLVLGTRSHRLERFTHRALTKIQTLLIGWFFGLKLKDISTPFRLIKRSEAVAALTAVPIAHVPVALAVPLYIGVAGRSTDILEVPVPHHPRQNLARQRGVLRLLWRGLVTFRGLFLYWLERPRLPMIPLFISKRTA